VASDHKGISGKKMPEKKFTESVTLRVTSIEKEKLRDDADIAGISVSELIRRRYFGIPIRARSDMITVKELRRLGGLLKSNFTTMRESGATENIMKQQEETLCAVVSMIDKLGASGDH
jgi:hypothetical protein